VWVGIFGPERQNCSPTATCAENIYPLRATEIIFQTVVAAVVFGPAFFSD